MAICILIKNSTSTGPADIQYRDIGDYLTREQKLDILQIEQSLEGTEWESITPNDHGDWINHRDENYDDFQSIGDKATKGKPGTPGIFENYSRGLATSRDSWCYNFSRDAVEINMRRTISNYEAERLLIGSTQPDTDPTKVSWNRGLLSDLAKDKEHSFDPLAVVTSAYRPFTKQTAYFSREMNDMIYQLPKLFPTPNHPNIALYMSSPGASKIFSPLIVDCVPNLHLVHTGQAYSLYTYEPLPDGELPMPNGDAVVVDGYRRKDNITDATLTAYRGFYEDPAISKEDIFYYVYGLLHSPTYKEQYKADLMKMLPRIPKVKDFRGFSTAGRELAGLHLSYETVEPYGLEEIVQGAPDGDEYDFYRVNKLSFGARKDRSHIIYNQRITLAGIPEQAFDYQVNGKSALEWIIDRYQVTTHKDSQITNDPNDYCREVGNPRYILDLIKRIVTVSVETNRTVAGLPALDIVE